MSSEALSRKTSTSCGVQLERHSARASGRLAIASVLSLGVFIGPMCLTLAGARSSAAAEVAAARNGEPEAKAPMTVVVTIPPLRGLVEPMLEAAGLSKGDGRGLAGSVQTLIPPGVSEHGYEIPPSKLVSLQRANVVILVGLGLEPQVEKMLTDRPRQGRRVLELAEALGIEATPGGHDCGHDHSKDADGGKSCEGHSHAADPHIWLDPVLVEKMVSKIAETLRDASGNDAQTHKRIWEAEEAMIERVKAMGARYAATLTPAKRRTLVVGHDAWGYLARRYELVTVPIKGLTASEPTPESLAAATNAIRNEGASAVFVEPQLSRKAGERIAQATGVPVKLLDPLGDGDWFKMMESNLRAIADGLGVEVAPETAVPAGR